MERKNGVQGLRQISEEEKEELYGYWISEASGDIQIFNEKTWISKCNSYFNPEYYKDTSVSWGENDIIIVKYTDSRPLLSENMYFFVSGDELILCGEKGFSKYIKRGEVIIFENYGVIP